MDQPVCREGFLYITKRTRNNVRYLACKNFRGLGCPATAKMTRVGNLEEFTLMNAHHNHPREDDKIEALQFKKQLKEACVKERGTLKNIYERLAVRNAVGALRIPFNSIRASMLRWRQSTTPNIPESLEQLSLILQSGTVTVDGSRAVIFGCREFVQKFDHSRSTFIDGTFKAVPRRPNFKQILTVFATCMDHAFPIIHVFMERRTKILYDAVFGYLKEHFPKFINENIVTDYEAALIESLRMMYPEATLHGCFFHYCQAVLRKAKALGIVRQIQGNMNGRILLRKYYALALLPAHTISETLDSLQEDMEFGLLFRELNDYIRRQWIGRVTPQHFSVYRQRHRTNNVMESYHRRLNSKLVLHPGAWDLMATIIDIQNAAIIEYNQLERGRQVYRTAKKDAVYNQNLHQAWDKLEDGRFTVDDFLRQAVHFVNDLDQQLDESNRNTADDEEPILAVLTTNPPLLEPPPLVPISSGASVVPITALNITPPIPPLAPPPNLNGPPDEPPPLIYFEGEPSNLRSHEQSPRSAPNFENVLHEVEHIDRVPDPTSPNSPSIPDPLLNLPPIPEVDLDFDSVPSSPNSPPIPEPVFNFPPIPEAIGRLFARLGDDDDPAVQINRIQRWEPRVAVKEIDEETMSPNLRCNICYLNQVQYCMECGHVFCTSCADVLFNQENARCGICRASLNREPMLFYLN